MESIFNQMDKSKIKSILEDFYIEYYNNLILPEKSKFGLEIEFKIPFFPKIEIHAYVLSYQKY